MMVISNSSPLISLAGIGRIELLPMTFSSILVPEVVWQEVVVNGRNRPGARDLLDADWIHQAVVKNRDLVISLRQNLGAGESESIALAVEKRADLLIMDERMGREAARAFSLAHIGVIGVLLQAKHKQVIPAVKPILNMLREQGAFRVSESLYQQVLQDQGEI